MNQPKNESIWRQISRYFANILKTLNKLKMADSLKMCRNLSVVLRMPHRDTAPLSTRTLGFYPYS